MDARYHIELFGHLRIVHGDRNVTRFRTHKAASLLAYLALHLSQTHSREKLVDLFWPNMDLDTGRDNLSTTLSSLRRQLEPAGVPAQSVLIADRQFVRLNTDTVTTDVSEFNALLRSAAGQEDPSLRAERYERAAALYRGDLLPGHYDEWVALEQTRWSERYVDALQQWGETLEGLGDLQTALDVYQRAIQADPYRESSYCALMRLHTALGSPAAALERYEALERFLKETLDLRPAETTRELAAQLRNDPHTVVPARLRSKQSAVAPSLARRKPDEIRTPPLSTPMEVATDPPDAHLPLQLTRFFGRENELAQLIELLAPGGPRLITLIGSGGAGKTRLSIEAARRVAATYAGRIWFVALADIPDPGLISYALSHSLQLPPAPGTDPMDRVVGKLQEGPCILVLDNFEHLLRGTDDNRKNDRASASGGTALIRLLLERAPELTCLVSSRQALMLGGEQEFPVPPLELPELVDAPEQLMKYGSVALYSDRAQAVKPDFALTHNNALAVSALCRKLEGIPLAIEMAAAWAKTIPPSRMLERLEHQLDLLVSRRRDLPARHQSLRATIEWSYDLLSPELRRFFARLSVFHGGWTLEKAEAICADESIAVPSDLLPLDILVQLQERSLIVAEERGEETRFRLLEPLREFAAEKLSESGDLERLRRVHATEFLALAEEAALHRYKPDSKLWLDRLEIEHDNLRAALDWSCGEEARGADNSDSPTKVEIGLRLAAALGWFWNAHGHLSEGRTWMDSLLALPSAAGRTRARARVLQSAGVLACLQTDYVAARALQEEGLAISRETADREGEAAALQGLGNIVFPERDFVAARTFYEASLAIRSEIGDEHGIASSCQNLGNVEFREENIEAARCFYTKALEIRCRLGDPLAAAYTMGSLGQLLQAQEDYAAAHRLCREVISTFREMGTRWGLVLSLKDMARLAYALGDTKRAVRLFSAVTALRESIHFPVPPSETAGEQESLDAVRASMAPSVFTEAWRRGSTMTWEEAIEDALAFSPPITERPVC